MALTIIFIGEKFYAESGTMMSPIYTENGERYDYGFLRCDLEAGKTIVIRPATGDEFRHYQQQLDKLKAEKKQDNP